MSNVKQPTLKNRKKSLALWLSQNPDLKNAMQKGVKTAQQDYLRSLSTYGTQGEQLAKAGLYGSGYSEYLSGLAYADRQNSVAQSKRDKENAMSKGYSAYLQGYEKTRASSEKSALSEILKQGIVDREQAYQLAASHGLSHGDALRLSETSVALSEEKQKKEKEALRLQVLQKMLNYGFKEKHGILYAQTYGFSESEATELAKLAERLYRAKRLGLMNSSYEDLIDYINQNYPQN